MVELKSWSIAKDILQDLKEIKELFHHSKKREWGTKRNPQIK